MIENPAVSKINWGLVGTVAAIAFQTVALTGAVISSANATQDKLTTVQTQIIYMQRDVDRLNSKVFP